MRADHSRAEELLLIVARSSARLKEQIRLYRKAVRKEIVIMTQVQLSLRHSASKNPHISRNSFRNFDEDWTQTISERVDSAPTLAIIRDRDCFGTEFLTIVELRGIQNIILRLILMTSHIHLRPRWTYRLCNLFRVTASCMVKNALLKLLKSSFSSAARSSMLTLICDYILKNNSWTKSFPMKRRGICATVAPR